MAHFKKDPTHSRGNSSVHVRYISDCGKWRIDGVGTEKVEQWELLILRGGTWYNLAACKTLTRAKYLAR